ncbi:hypothetical protein NQZ68_026301 [Dissostichus eleginoides]|nr:hypothetical protein NQZ68_026301 [Dissostichus eleginoides]
MCLGTKKTSTILQIAPDTEEDSGEEEEHAQPANNTRRGKNGESSMESLALRRGKRKCLKAQYETDEIVG